MPVSFCSHHARRVRRVARARPPLAPMRAGLTVGALPSHAPFVQPPERVADRILRISTSRLHASTQDNLSTAQSCRLVFEAVYVLLAAAATGDETAGSRRPSPHLASLGAIRLCLSSDDVELSQALAGVYGLPGWETLDFGFLHAWATRVVAFVRAVAAASVSSETFEAIDRSASSDAAAGGMCAPTGGAPAGGELK